MKRPVSKRLFLIMAVTGCILLLSVLFFRDSQKLICAGVSVQGINVGGLTVEEARERLTTLVENKNSRQVILKYGNETWKYSCRELGVLVELEGALLEAQNWGKKGPCWQQLFHRLQARLGGKDFRIPVVLDRQTALVNLEELKRKLNYEPRDADFEVNADNSISIIPSRKGRSVDIDYILDVIESNLEKDGSIRIEVRVKEVLPEITTREAQDMQITSLLAEYATSFNADLQNRTENLKKAASSLDGMLISPGEIFSFNKAVGPRTKETGYKEATIIENNKFVAGLGGGVCQVSTTLYNAVLRANLKIVERHKHSLPVFYVPRGMDAAVAYNYLDLKFKNNSPGYLLLKASSAKGVLKIGIFGNNKDLPQVKITNRVEKVFPAPVEYKYTSSLPAGESKIIQKGADGYLVEVWRELYRNGKGYQKEFISRDKYPPIPKVILSGQGVVSERDT